MHHESIRRHVRVVPVASLLLLALALAGCSAGAGDDGAPASSLDAGAAAPGGATTPAESDTDSDDTDPQTDEGEQPAPPLDHSSALAAGIAGETAITCEYTYDEQELATLRAFAGGGEVMPGATVYLDGSTVYWDLPEPGGVLGHLLSYEGEVYTWMEPDATGAWAPSEDPEGERALLTERMERNASECAAYTGPASIFEVPEEITFSGFPG